jgi:hypothetical protein
MSIERADADDGLFDMKRGRPRPHSMAQIEDMPVHGQGSEYGFRTLLQSPPANLHGNRIQVSLNGKITSEIL